jgi:hypothetical protein
VKKDTTPRKWFTVIALYVENRQRFATSVLADNSEQAEALAQAEAEAEIEVAGVCAGKVPLVA